MTYKGALIKPPPPAIRIAPLKSTVPSRAEGEHEMLSEQRRFFFYGNDEVEGREGREKMSGEG